MNNKISRNPSKGSDKSNTKSDKLIFRTQAQSELKEPNYFIRSCHYLISVELGEN